MKKAVMKKTLYFATTLSAIFIFSCAKQETFLSNTSAEPNSENVIASDPEFTPLVIHGVVEENVGTKTTYTYEGEYYSFTWNEADLVTVQVISTSDAADKIRFKAKSTGSTTDLIQDGNTFDLSTGHDKDGYSNKGYYLGNYAFYPATTNTNSTEISYIHGSGAVTLNNGLDVYSNAVDGTSIESSTIPLIGKKDGEAANNDGTPNAVFKFKNATGVLRLTLNNIPSSADKLVLTANGDVDISNGKNVLRGTWALSDALFTDGLTMASATTGYNIRTYNIATLAGQSKDIYVPVPVGTIEGLSIEILDSSDKRLYFVRTGDVIEIHRSIIKSLTAITCKSATVYITGTSTGPVLNYNQTVGYIYADVSRSSTNDLSKYPIGLKFSRHEGTDEVYNDLATAFSSEFDGGSGLYYLHYVALSSDPANESALHALTLDHKTVKTYGTVPFYYLSDTDRTNLVGTFSTPRSGVTKPTDNEEEQTIVLEASTDLTKGNVMVTTAFRRAYSNRPAYGVVDGSSLTVFKSSDDSYFWVNGTNYWYLGQSNSYVDVNSEITGMEDIVFSIATSPSVTLTNSAVIHWYYHSGGTGGSDLEWTYGQNLVFTKK